MFLPVPTDVRGTLFLTDFRFPPSESLAPEWRPCRKMKALTVLVRASEFFHAVVMTQLADTVPADHAEHKAWLHDTKLAQQRRETVLQAGVLLGFSRRRPVLRAAPAAMSCVVPISIFVPIALQVQAPRLPFLLSLVIHIRSSLQLGVVTFVQMGSIMSQIAADKGNQCW